MTAKSIGRKSAFVAFSSLLLLYLSPAARGEVLEFDCTYRSTGWVNRQFPNGVGRTSIPTDWYVRIDTVTRTAVNEKGSVSWKEVRVSPQEITLCEWTCDTTESVEQFNQFRQVTIDRDTGDLSGEYRNGKVDDERELTGQIDGECEQR